MGISTRNLELDALRAGSILLVVFAHSRFSFVPGGFGVTTFFVISGFIITKLIVNEVTKYRDFSLWKFYARRFWKIAPPFVFIIVCPSIIAWKIQDIELIKFLSQILFFFNWIKISSGTEGVMLGTGVVWSLSIEEQFYLVVAILTWAARKNKYKNLSKYLLMVFTWAWFYSLSSRIYISFIDQSKNIYDDTGNLSRIYLGTDTRMSSICAGAILAILAPKLAHFINSNFQKRIFLCAVGISIPILLVISLLIRNNHFRDTFRYSMQELAICLLILIGPILGWTPLKLKKTLETRIVQMIGVSSYCIYLSHLILILVFQQLFSSPRKPNQFLLDLAFATTAISLGTALYLITDKPFETMRRKYRR